MGFYGILHSWEHDLLKCGQLGKLLRLRSKKLRSQIENEHKGKESMSKHSQLNLLKPNIARYIVLAVNSTYIDHMVNFEPENMK